MARNTSSWSLRGVSPAAREAAKNSAAEAGVSLGAWLAKLITEVNAMELEQAAAAAAAVEKPKPARPSSIERAMQRAATGNPAAGFGAA